MSPSTLPDDPAALRARVAELEAELARVGSIDAHLHAMMQSAKGFGLYRLVKDPDARYGSRVVFASPSITEMLGASDASDFATWFERIHPDDRPRIEAEEREAAPSGRAFEAIMRVRAEGETAWRWIQAVSHPVRDDDGAITHYDGIMADITESRRTRSALRLRDRAIEASSNAVVISRLDNGTWPVVYVNPAFELLTGFRAEEFLGTDGRLLFQDSPDSADRRVLDDAWSERRGADAVLGANHRDGTRFWVHVVTTPVADDAGNVTHYVTVMSDVTQTVRQQEDLQHQATHDALTGLPNRTLLQDRLEHAIAAAKRDDAEVVVAFIDLDNFKYVNDSLGHDAGDDLLVTIAERLRQCMRQGDTIARYSGDEFVVVIPIAEDAVPPLSVINRMAGAIAQPIRVAGHAHRLTCSIGFCTFPQDGADPATLLRNADATMHEAKAAGRDSVLEYSVSTAQKFHERLTIESSLRVAVERDQIRVEFQPIVDVATGRVIGAETLARWSDPDHGEVSPARFIPLAEETGLINAIGRRVLDKACQCAREWESSGIPDLRVSVNLSARQFHSDDVVRIVENALVCSGLAPTRLDLELTEGVIVPQGTRVQETIDALRDLGVTLSIDDFGTGYSSLAYLQRFPASTLKVDRAFLRDVPGNTENVGIVRAIIALARTLGLRTVAEGVETEAQLGMVRKLGCDAFQGFLVSPALRQPDFVDFVRRHNASCETEAP